MKLEDANKSIAKITGWKAKNRRRELAYLRRGPKPENLVNCLGVVTEFVYPTNRADLTAAAEVLSAFVVGDCENGRLGFGTALGILVRNFPSADLRAQHVLMAQTTDELSGELRYVLTLMRKNGITPNFASVLADVVNFPAWREEIITRWSIGYFKGLKAEKSDAQTSTQEAEA